MARKVIVNLLRDEIMLIRQSQRFARCINVFRARFSMRLVRPFDFRDALADERMRDDELRFPVVTFLGDVQRIEKLLHVLAVDFLNVEPVGSKALASVFALGCFRRRIERDAVGIVNQDQIIEAPMTSQCTRFRRDAFLHVAIAA